MNSIHPKVQAVGATGAVATLAAVTLSAFGITVPMAVVAAVLTLIVTGAGYIKRGPAIVAEVNTEAANVTPVVEQVAPIVAAEVKKVEASPAPAAPAAPATPATPEVAGS